MLQLVLMLSFLGQVDETQRQREWLMAHLIVDNHFSDVKIKDIEAKLAKMSPTQVGELIAAYKDKQYQIKQSQNEAVASAIYQLRTAEAYRDYLALKYKKELSVKQKEADLMKESTKWMRYRYPPYHYHYR
jgi:hypothetical protein